MAANYTKARQEAKRLLQKYRVDEPIIPIFDIVEKEGLEIQAMEMPPALENVAGFLEPDKKMIYINVNDPPNRQTFTVAHELGHYILAHNKDNLNVLLRYPLLQNAKKDPLEQEANCFAAELLVPSKMLKRVMKKYSLEKGDEEILAGMFGVSKDVMKYSIMRI